MPRLRNPGLYSVLIFLIAAILVGFLTYMKVPEAGKLSGTLVALAVAAFGAKSALEAKDKRAALEAKREAMAITAAARQVPPPLPRAPMPTWPEVPVTQGELDDLSDAPDTVREEALK